MSRLAVSVACVLLAAVAWRDAGTIQAQERQRLDVDGALDLRLASNGRIAVLVAQTGRSGLAVFRSVNGSPFGSTEFIVPPDPLDRRVYGVWATPRGFFAVQHTRSLLPRLSRSVDGARWETIQSSAFDTPAHIYDLVQLPGGDLLAVGALRRGATGPSSAAMWRSGDGITWQRAPTDKELAGASFFSSIATMGTTVIVAGDRSGPAVWRSDDGGASWVFTDGRRQAETVAATSGRFVLFAPHLLVESPDLAFATSSDGREWHDGIASGFLAEGLRLLPRHVAKTTSGIFLIGSTLLDLSSALDRCYALPAQCSEGSGSVVVLHTTTGDTWRAIDVASLVAPGVANVAIADVEASTVVAAAVGGRVEIISVPPLSWPYTAPRSRPQLPSLPPLVAADGLVEPGTLYRYPKNVHCGMEWLDRYNGQTWKLRRQLVGTPGDPRTARTLPQVQETLLGTVRLTAPDTIEYAIEGLGVVAVYGPTSEPLPICI